jgi:hypothetical protein
MANQINIQVGADIKELQTGISQAVQVMQDAGRDMTGVSESVRRLTEGNFKSLSQAYRTTSRDAEILASHLGTESEAFRQAAQMAQAYGTQLNDVRAKIAGIDLTNQPVQKAAGQFNMLGNSINQLTRELPAFTYSMQTGFMAISNNIPMFVDQIQAIKRANVELVKSGQPVQSVFTQISSAFFSFNTAISLGVTALTMFGPALISSLVGIKETAQEIENAKNAMRAYNDEIDRFILSEQDLAIQRLNIAYANAKKKIDDQIVIAQMQMDITKRSGQEISAEEIKNVKKLKDTLLVMENNYQGQVSKIREKFKEEPKKEYNLKMPVELELKEGVMQKFTTELLNKDTRIKLKKFFGEVGGDMLKSTIDIKDFVEKVERPISALEERIGKYSELIASALSNIGVALGQALVTGEFEDAGKTIIKMLGQIAAQIGAAMIAIGIPMLGTPLATEGIKLIAGGTALTIVGGAMMASGSPSKSSSGGGGGSIASGSMQSSMPNFQPQFASNSQFLMLDSRVRGTDIIISANNQSRQNRRIR